MFENCPLFCLIYQGIGERIAGSTAEVFSPQDMFDENRANSAFTNALSAAEKLCEVCDKFILGELSR